MTFDNQAGDTTNDPPRATCTCETCKLRRFEDSAIRHAVVHNYSYNPRTWRKNSVRNDPFDYYLGVELETDNYRLSNGSRVYADLSNGQAVSCARPARLWLAKSDASVSGPEFVSHPATLTYWHSKSAELTEMFRMLVHGGFRSHDNDHAGMHVSISKNAFDNQRHLFRFLTLIHEDASWSIKMAQRSEASARQWASLEDLRTAEQREAEVRRIFPTQAQLDSMDSYSRRYIGSGNRYMALNCPTGAGIHVGGRFEFRLPRGTLRLDRFYKNLEWTVAMVEFTRTCTIGEAEHMAFMRWVLTREQRESYPNLARFLTERFDDYIVVADDLIPTGATPRIVSRRSVRPTRQAAAVEPERSNDGVRISPRTGRPVRQYTRRPGARRPGRPTGYSPRRSRDTINITTAIDSAYDADVLTSAPFGADNRPACMAQDQNGYGCERVDGHTGSHAAFTYREPATRLVWATDYAPQS